MRKFVDLKREPEKTEASPADVHFTGLDYPPGMCLMLNDETMKKMDLDASAVVGDMLHIHAIAKVTSVASHEAAGDRIELQVTHLAIEDEDKENARYEKDEDEGNRSPVVSKTPKAESRYGWPDKENA